jgi:hypothetical protein
LFPTWEDLKEIPRLSTVRESSKVGRVIMVKRSILGKTNVSTENYLDEKKKSTHPGGTRISRSRRRRESIKHRRGQNLTEIPKRGF